MARKRKPFKAKVTKVYDGDSFETEDGIQVRLANVDAPEKRQPGYQEIKGELKDLIQDEVVLIDPKATDDYGRTVALVKKGSKSVNAAIKKKTGK